MRWMLLLLVLLSGPLAAAEFPPDFAAYYDIKKAGLVVGKSDRRMTRQKDGTALYISHSKTHGLLAIFAPEDIEETTRLMIHDGNARPLTYEKNRDGNIDEHIVHQYDWVKKQIFIRRNDEKKQKPIEGRVLDQNAFQLALMMDLAEGKRKLDYNITSDTRLNPYDIRVTKEERIDTELGKLKTLVVSSTHKKTKTVLWCAEKYHYLPVKILRIEDGVSFTAYITKLQGMR